MGDSGEGLVDAESRIQERIEELQVERALKQKSDRPNPELIRKIDSLKLIRTETTHQLQIARNPARKAQLSGALADIDSRIEELEQALNSSH